MSPLGGSRLPMLGWADDEAFFAGWDKDHDDDHVARGSGFTQNSELNRLRGILVFERFTRIGYQRPH